MEIRGIPFRVIDWSALSPEVHPGESGTSSWRTAESGDLRARLVEYSPGYRSDHWCPRGHVFFVFEGEFGILMKSGESYVLRPGMGFVASDDPENPHLGYSEAGAKAFVVD